MNYSLVTIRGVRERLERFVQTYELDVLSETPVEIHGLLPDDQIDLAREDGYDVQVMGHLVVSV
ncbi:MAG: hypothetical protein HYR60_09240 [Acidobacteria bacterium]|nr:hypothetical protein [Acidobacteriota bacterium]MBI3473386.1 hypothetical protein [Candidatus Solibacter usitatus]